MDRGRDTFGESCTLAGRARSCCRAGPLTRLLVTAVHHPICEMPRVQYSALLSSECSSRHVDQCLDYQRLCTLNSGYYCCLRLPALVFFLSIGVCGLCGILCTLWKKWYVVLQGLESCAATANGESMRQCGAHANIFARNKHKHVNCVG